MTEDEIRLVFARNLKSFREEKGLSQMALALKAEIATNFVNDIENCKKWISPATLSKLSNALGISPYKFFLPNQIYASDCNEVLNQFCIELSNNFLESVKSLSEKYSK